MDCRVEIVGIVLFSTQVRVFVLKQSFDKFIMSLTLKYDFFFMHGR